MVALKATEIERFVARPPAAAAIILVYGPDTGLVSERAQALVESASDGSDDPFSLARLDAADLASDPDRLIDEALTVPLFGGRRVIWVRDAGGRNLVPAVAPLLKLADCPAFVVIEAGDLKKGTGLRKLFEADRRAVALPCYADTGRDIDYLIDEETRLAGLTISREARAALHGLLGADRMASRGELRKLCLYAHGRQRIDTDDIAAIIGDASAFEMSELIDAAAGGDLAALDHGLERLEAEGGNASVIAGQALVHFQGLHRMRAEFDAGTPAAQIVDAARPPVFFKRKAALARQIQLWSAADLDKAMERLAEAMRTARLNDRIGMPVLSEALLTLARVARARGSARR
ncbi:DNA polymerase III subunit delta [Polymorphum gilvum]|uniref:DNA polymerase III subunit delta n=1 Tax=Polymorphum gilvum (strain LMG 25793 / CGMCC 1.9160 / SL003B-26A1) TaxID=991905 RepID=F2IYK7_POLGS|nr:DNA polymerase III subunit delta [Polymorphum gilvum]ADZ68520.1 DNA polymerase III, delta subunit [Polymorphum gilvum SL003B-26A1]